MLLLGFFVFASAQNGFTDFYTEQKKRGSQCLKNEFKIYFLLKNETLRCYFQTVCKDGAYKLKINLRSMQKEEQTNDLLTRKGRLSMANGNSLLKLMQ